MKEITKLLLALYLVKIVSLQTPCEALKAKSNNSLKILRFRFEGKSWIDEILKISQPNDLNLLIHGTGGNLLRLGGNNFLVIGALRSLVFKNNPNKRKTLARRPIRFLECLQEQCHVVNPYPRDNYRIGGGGETAEHNEIQSSEYLSFEEEHHKPFLPRMQFNPWIFGKVTKGNAECQILRLEVPTDRTDIYEVRYSIVLVCYNVKKDMGSRNTSDPEMLLSTHIIPKLYNVADLDLPKPRIQLEGSNLRISITHGYNEKHSVIEFLMPDEKNLESPEFICEFEAKFSEFKNESSSIKPVFDIYEFKMEDSELYKQYKKIIVATKYPSESKHYLELSDGNDHYCIDDVSPDLVSRL